VNRTIIFFPSSDRVAPFEARLKPMFPQTRASGKPANEARFLIR